MFAWLIFHFQKFIAYLTAPILFHCSVDGYVMSAYFTINEMADVYGIFIIASLLALLSVYYRNTVFSIYLKSKALLIKGLGVITSSNKTVAQISNKIKSLVLTTSVFYTIRSFFTGVYASLKKYLRK